MFHSKIRRFVSLSVGVILACTTLGFSGGVASADPVPHTVCLGGQGVSTFSPPLDLTPSQTHFTGSSTANACLGAFVGAVEVTSLVGDGLLSCELSLVQQGTIKLDWTGDQQAHSTGVVVLATNVSKGIVFDFDITQGLFAGQSGKLTVESTSNTLNCLSGLSEIRGPSQLVFGV